MKLFSRAFLLAVVIGLAVVATGQAEVRLPKIFSSNMVLQRDLPIQVWGWAETGEEVTVKVADRSVTVKACSDGKWRATLKPLSAGGPYKLTVTAESGEPITLEDVLVGEVWVCSGQSNMQWSVRAADNAEEEIAAANFPNLRLFSVTRAVAATPQEDCEGTWQACSSETVPNFSAVGYYFGRKLHQDLDVPVGLINTSWGGTRAEAWTSKAPLEAHPMLRPMVEASAVFRPGNPHQASVLYNAMIQPIVPLGIRGAIWYQGESNRSRAEQYATLFPTMITDWRAQWQQGYFPFLFVQLAPFEYRGADPAELAEIWEAQSKTLALPATGMAVTTDITNIKNIHPTNKQDVGARLALWALAKTYGQEDLVYSGPLYKSMEIKDGKIELTFDHVGGGLVAKDGPLTHFTIARADGNFVPAVAEIEGETVVVSSPEVTEPKSVRFGWHHTAEPNFFNAAGLPASPFRTDSLPLVTAGRR